MPLQTIHLRGLPLVSSKQKAVLIFRKHLTIIPAYIDQDPGSRALLFLTEMLMLEKQQWPMKRNPQMIQKTATKRGKPPTWPGGVWSTCSRLSNTMNQRDYMFSTGDSEIRARGLQSVCHYSPTTRRIEFDVLPFEHSHFWHHGACTAIQARSHIRTLNMKSLWFIIEVHLEGIV